MADLEKVKGDLKESKRELENLQVKALSSLVESVVVGSTIKKLLYLTNNQAEKVDLSNIHGFLNSFGIKTSGRHQPKLIINLFESMAHTPTSASTWFQSDPNARRNFGEKSVEDMIETEEKISLFLKNHIIPLAIQTNAIIVTNAIYCTLSRILSDLCEAEAAARKGQLPFTVVQFGLSFLYWKSSLEKESLAHAFKNKSKRWAETDHVYDSYWNNASNPEERINLQTLSLLQGATHYIIVDGFGEEMIWNQRDWKPIQVLKNNFIQQLAKDLPSIALQTQMIKDSNSIQKCSQYVLQGLPLLFIDSRPKPMGGGYPNTLELLESILIDREQTLLDHDSWEMYHSSIIAAIREVFKIIDSTTTTSNLSTSLTFSTTTTTTSDTSKQPLYKAIERLKYQSEENRQIGDTSQTTNNDRAQKAVALFQRIMKISDTKRLEKYTQSLEELQNKILDIEKDTLNNPLLQLDQLIRETSCEWKLNLWVERSSKIDYLVTNYGNMFEYELKYDDDGKLFIKHIKLSAQVKHQEISDVIAVLLNSITLWKEEPKILNCLGPHDWWLFSQPLQWDTFLYISVYNLFSSNNVYSGNIDEPLKLKAIIDKVANISRLPQYNSKEALCILRTAWDYVDICTHIAKVYKWITKLAYFLVLALTIAITTATLISFNTPYLISSTTLRYIIVACSLALSAVGGANGYFSPAVKWQQLKGQAMILESEVWMFRTRTEKYVSDSTSPASNSTELMAENNLKECIVEAMQNIKKSAAVMESSFFSLFSVSGQPTTSKIFKHGQYPGGRGMQSFDSERGTSSTNKVIKVYPQFPVASASPRLTPVSNNHGARKVVANDLQGINIDVEDPGKRPVLYDYDITSNSSRMIDDHHSPLKADEYIELRAYRALMFYQSRLPRYYRLRTMLELFLILGSLSGTLLALTNSAMWAAIVTSCTAATTAWLEFQNTSKKLARYNNSVDQIKKLLLWWESMTAMERASLANVNALVIGCESIILSEMQAWMATSMAQKLLRKITGSKDDSKEV